MALHGVLRLADTDRLRPVLPEPAHRIGEDRRGVAAAVDPLAPDVFDLIAGKRQGPLQGLIPHPPVADLRPAEPLIVRAVLHEHADRLGLGFAHQDRIAVPAAHPHKRADRREHPPERVGPLPGEREGRDPARASASRAAVVRVL
jgi:hypothetical protein